MDGKFKWRTPSEALCARTGNDRFILRRRCGYRDERHVRTGMKFLTEETRSDLRMLARKSMETSSRLLKISANKIDSNPQIA